MLRKVIGEIAKRAGHRPNEKDVPFHKIIQTSNGIQIVEELTSEEAEALRSFVKNSHQ